VTENLSSGLAVVSLRRYFPPYVRRNDLSVEFFTILLEESK
jgi:hypothetical protein